MHSNYKSYLSQIPHSSYQLSRISRLQILSLKGYFTLKKRKEKKKDMVFLIHQRASQSNLLLLIFPSSALVPHRAVSQMRPKGNKKKKNLNHLEILLSAHILWPCLNPTERRIWGSCTQQSVLFKNFS